MTQGRPAAVYARVSTEEQVEGTSLGTQVDEAKRYIESHGLTLGGDGVYVDEGVSGSLGSRPALDRLMAAARSGYVQVIVVAKLDRFGRSVVHLSKTLAELDALGVEFVSLAEAIDGTTSAGRLQRTLLSAFAEFERDRIRERTQAGADAVARDGYWPSGDTPYGLRTVAEGRRKKAAIDEEEQNAILHAVECIVDKGMSTWDTAASLNALGLRPRKSSSWTGHRLRDVLLNGACLSGTYVWRKGRKGETAIPVPAILTPERHEALKAAMARTRRSMTYRKHFYLLSEGRITSPCGGRMHGHTSDGAVGASAPVYRCQWGWASVPKADRCDCKTLRRDVIDEAVWAEVVRLLSDPEALMSGASEAIAVSTASQGVGAEDLAALDRRIARLERIAGEGLAKALRAGIDPLIAQHASASLYEELEGLREHRRKVVGWLQINSQRTSRAERLWQLANRASQMLGEPTEDLKRTVIDSLDLRVVLRGFNVCARCEGTGFVDVAYESGRPKGRNRRDICPVCKRTKRTPVWSMAGEVPNELPVNPAIPVAPVEPGVPFRVVSGDLGA